MAPFVVRCGLVLLLLGEAARVSLELDAQSNASDGLERKLSFAASQLVIWADYDGCFDIASPTNANAEATWKKTERQAAPLQVAVKPFKTVTEIKEMLMAKLKEAAVGYEQVTLFIGSNRQSSDLEDVNIGTNKNGNAMDGLEKLVEKLNAESGGSPPWKFNNAILETETKEDGRKRWSSTQIDNLFEQGSAPVKRAMAKNLYKHLRKDVASEGDVDVIFFDDVPDYLVAVSQVKIPPGVHLYLAHFDHVNVAFLGKQIVMTGPYSEEKRKTGWVKASDFNV